MQLKSMADVKALSTLAGYIGGKRNFAPPIVKGIEATQHDYYAEPFFGMGGIFFRRGRMPKGEAINDINSEVITLFRVIQRHYDALIDTLKFQVHAREEFYRLSRQDPKDLTDIERSARFLYILKSCYAGKMVHPSFASKIEGSNPRPTAIGWPALIEATHERLRKVTIENLPYSEFIKRYDRPGILFYLDPPYFKCEHFYGKGIFSRNDFDQIAELLTGIKGRFLLSINDTPEIRKIFKNFKINTVSGSYSTGTDHRKRKGIKGLKVIELLIESK